MIRIVADILTVIAIGLLIAGGLWLMLNSRCVVQWPTRPNWGGNVGSPTLIQEGEL